MSEPVLPRPAGGKPKRGPPRKLTVSGVSQVTPGLIRVTFSGPELEGFAPPRPAAHIKLVMVPEGVAWNPLDETGPRPPRRTYTPRRFDPTRLTLDVEFVLHGVGLASDWATQAKRGQTMFIGGPGGGYDVPTDATALVIVADDTALPAAGMILDAMPAGCAPIVLAEVADKEEERTLSERSGVSPRWLHRESAKAQPCTLLEEAVRKLDLPAGASPYWWIACEAGAMRRIKQHLLRERGIEPSRLHTRGYWKLGETEYPDHDYGKD